MRSLIRSLTPPWFVVVGLVGFLAAEAFLQWAERRLGVVALDLKVRPSLYLLYFVALMYGGYCAAVRHPFFSRGYQDWLTQTPWTVAKPLPLGSIQIDGRDGLVLGLLVALNLVAPEPTRDSMRVLCVFLFGHCALLTYANWYTTNRAYAYLSAFGLALMVRLIPHPWACIATGTAVYLVTHEGVWQALRGFPWERSFTINQIGVYDTMLSDQAIRDGKGKTVPCGWPYDQLLRDPVATTPAPETGLDALIWCLLLGWWISCLASRFTLRSDAQGFTTFCLVGVFFISFFWRVGVYIYGYFSPLSLAGRIRTGRWIIPEHDVVFLAPLLMILAFATAAVGFAGRLVAVDVYGPIITGMIVFIALRTPPSLRQWRLTGGHRMIPNGARVAGDPPGRT